MDMATYQHEVRRFMPAPSATDSPLHADLRLATFGLGLSGEYGEMSVAFGMLDFETTRDRELKASNYDLYKLAQQDKTIHLLDEIGDVLWYCGAVCNASSTSLRDSYVKSDTHAERIVDLTHTGRFSFGYRGAGEVAEAIKKYVGHGKALNCGKVEVGLARVIATLRYYSCVAQATLTDVAAANIAKLSKRYPQGFQVGGGVR